MTSLLTRSIEHERRCRGDIRRPAPPDDEMTRQAQRAAQITTALMAEVTGPATLEQEIQNELVKRSIPAQAEDSFRFGYSKIRYAALWQAYSRLAVRAGEVEANQLE